MCRSRLGSEQEKPHDSQQQSRRVRGDSMNKKETKSQHGGAGRLAAVRWAMGGRGVRRICLGRLGEWTSEKQ